MKMKKILVAYATYSGSTADVAQYIAKEMANESFQIDVCPIEEVTDLTSYSAFVIGAPMILKWHPAALKFITKNEEILSRMPVAYFFTAMSLTKPQTQYLDTIPLFVDPNLAKDPKNPNRLSLKERYATVANYLRPVLKTAPHIKPINVAFFGGSLQLFKLKWYAMLFVLLIIQAKPGDNRNWQGIQTWAAGLIPLFFMKSRSNP